MDKIKNQLAGVAALLGVIAAIGGGFVKYGEIVTKLDALEGASGGKDWSAEIAVLEEKVTAFKNEVSKQSTDVQAFINKYVVLEPYVIQKPTEIDQVALEQLSSNIIKPFKIQNIQ